MQATQLSQVEIQENQFRHRGGIFLGEKCSGGDVLEGLSAITDMLDAVRETALFQSAQSQVRIGRIIFDQKNIRHEGRRRRWFFPLIGLFHCVAPVWLNYNQELKANRRHVK